MFSKSTIDSATEAFGKQFEVENGRLVYRRAQKGAAYEVSEGERDDFVVAYRRGIKRDIWISLLVLLTSMAALLGIITAIDVDVGSVTIQLTILGTMLVWITVFMVFWMRRYHAPSVELSHRLSIGGERSSREMNARRFSKTTYGNLALGTAAVAFLFWKGWTEDEIVMRWFSFALAGGLFVFLLVQTVRKVIYDRSNPTP